MKLPVIFYSGKEEKTTPGSVLELGCLNTEERGENRGVGGGVRGGEGSKETVKVSAACLGSK